MKVGCLSQKHRENFMLYHKIRYPLDTFIIIGFSSSTISLVLGDINNINSLNFWLTYFVNVCM